MASLSANQAEVRCQLLDAVDSIGAVLRANLEDDERARRLSPQSAEALHQSGILTMKLPRALGGFEADLPTQFEVIEALALASPSAAWCAMVGATSLALPGAFLPEAGVKTMFNADTAPRGAIVIMPAGKAHPVAGGYQLSGRWSFASGIHDAEWVSAHALYFASPEAQPKLYMFTFPADLVAIHDNWQVLGLRGTGSCDISVEELVVPDAMAWAVGEQAPQRGGGLYGLGIPAFVAYEHAAFAVGVARSALQRLSELATTKRRGYGPDAGGLANRAVVQRFIGRADLQLRAARTLTMALNQQAMELADAGEQPSIKLSLELRASATYCTEVASEIVNEAFRHAGASAIFEGNALQRCQRDLNVAAQHFMVSDSAYELLGQVHLGVEQLNPMA